MVLAEELQARGQEVIVYAQLVVLKRLISRELLV